jgi:hypothetical protein
LQSGLFWLLSLRASTLRRSHTNVKPTEPCSPLRHTKTFQTGTIVALMLLRFDSTTVPGDDGTDVLIRPSGR